MIFSSEPPLASREPLSRHAPGSPVRTKRRRASPLVNYGPRAALSLPWLLSRDTLASSIALAAKVGPSVQMDRYLGP